jgi:N-acetylmuramoyl-L-alanine amidase
MKTNDSMTGINWSEIPVTIIELGFMSNPEEDKLMQDSNMQNNMVQGIANGLDTYFGF